MRSRTIWIPGGSGMLGQAVAAALRARGHQGLSTGRALDIAEPAAVQNFLAEHAEVSGIINCAAKTAVDACEAEEADAMRINAGGTACLAAAAAARGLPLVHVSTDYVFAGDAHAPYEEDHAVAPNTAYGRSKLAGEQALWRTMASGQSAFVVRTSWLFGHGGNNFVATMLRLMKDRPRVEVVDDQIGSPTFCDDLAEALVDLALPEGRTQAAPGTYHFANAGQTSWHGLASAARDLALARGQALACQEVLRTTSAAFVRPARRPAYSVLNTQKLARARGREARPWQDALAAYVAATATDSSNFRKGL